MKEDKIIINSIYYGIIVLSIFIALIFGFGYVNANYIKTVGKAKQNTEREVYEETNSFTKAKRQQAIKLYKEWKECKTKEDKAAIETIIQMDFADFDEDKYIKNPELLSFIKKAKY